MPFQLAGIQTDLGVEAERIDLAQVQICLASDYAWHGVRGRLLTLQYTRGCLS